jgi:DNA-binding transcriptional regulator GbsR (MarR family)
MKGHGPTESLRKIPELTPALSRFIEGMGVYFEDQGIPRIGGRMLGLLMIAHWPLTAQDIATILGISRGSVSTNFRLLLTSGLAEKVALPGNRTTHYVFSDAAMEHRITAGMQSIIAFKKIVQQASAVIPARDPARHHIDDSLEWSDLLIESFDRATEKWRLRRPARSHTHAATSGE